jgi:2-keto-4-pentenoate hydratase/2-oxohepta-3-ene-1,7-dioic acid hydratase in catechol pathway
VIATGTPAGVGAGRRPQRFLQAGDVIEITIGDLGTLVTPIADPHPDERTA